MGFAESSLFAKVALALSAVALLFDLIGLASPYWLTSIYGNLVLFQQCGKGLGCSSIPYPSSELEAAQAMSVIGFLAGVAAVVLIAIYILQNKPIFRLIGMIVTFVAAGFILIGVIIVGDLNVVYDIGWAMILAIIGALIFIGSGVVLVVDMMKK